MGARPAPDAAGQAALEALARLRNLGPASARMLVAAGIGSADALRDLGAIQAWLRVQRAGGRASLNLLWALEGALTDRAWQDVARRDGASLRMALEDAERQGREGWAPAAARRRPPPGR